MYIKGANLSVGDLHFSQGDVSILVLVVVVHAFMSDNTSRERYDMLRFPSFT